MRKLRRCAAVFTGFAGVLAAQTVVVTGTGDANVDVPAVQAAVDKGGWVVLMAISPSTGRLLHPQGKCTPVW